EAAPVHPYNDVARSVAFDSHELELELARMRAEDPALGALRTRGASLTQNLLRAFRGDRDPRELFQPQFCGAHRDMYVFDAHGDVYKCYERTGDPGLRIGRVTDAGRIELRRPAPPAPHAGRGRRLPVV